MRSGTRPSPRLPRLLRSTAGALGLLVPVLVPLAACSDEAPEQVESIQLAPASATLVAGQTLTLTATTLGSSGNTLSGHPLTWTSSHPEVAGVDANGFVTTAAPGVTIVAAACEGKFGAATITVIPIPVASVVVQPDTATLFVGQSVQFSAATLDSLGRPLAGRTIAWASSGPGVAAVSPAGLATAASAGTATITAASEGRSGAARVTVTVRVLTGTWSGTMLAASTTVRIDYTLAEAADGKVTGTTRISFGSTSLSGTVSGMRTGNVVSLTSTFAGYQPYTYTGTIDAAVTVITGTINGSGFVNQPLTINRTGASPSSAAVQAGAPVPVPASGLLVDAVTRRSS